MKHVLSIATLLLAPLAAIHAAPAPAEAKPNIVYLFADQWRPSATGYAGDRNVKTPNLDRLAKEVGSGDKQVVPTVPENRNTREQYSEQSTRSIAPWVISLWET